MSVLASTQATTWVRRISRAAPYVVVVVPLVLLTIELATFDGPSILWGDQALVEISAKRVLMGDELLGPYSRFGWHHPGPAWPFLLGVLATVGGGTTNAVLVAGVLVHALAALLTVFTGQRIAGSAGAWIATLSALAVMETLGFVDRIASLWNPWAVVVPTLLFVAICVLLADRRHAWPPVTGALAVCGSFLVQTHISIALIVVTLPVVAVAIRWLRPLQPTEPTPTTPRGWILLGVAAVATVAMWTPPLIEQLTRDVGNVRSLVDHAQADRERPPARTAVIAVGNLLRAFPSGTDSSPGIAEARTGTAGGRLWFPFVYVALAAALAALAVQRRLVVAFACAVLGATAVVVALASALLADPPLMPYLLAWVGALPVFIWAAAVAVVVDVLPALARTPALATTVALTAAVGAGCSVQVADHPNVGRAVVGGAGSQSWAALRPVVMATDLPVVMTPYEGGAMADAAAVAGQLERRGRPWGVGPGWEVVFGEAAKQPQGDFVNLLFVPSNSTPSLPESAVEVAVSATTRVYRIDD